MKRCGTILIALFVLMSIMPVWADVDYEAEVLHDLNLIEGTGNGFNLGARLTRAEAATFIVSVLGKTNHVLNNADRYKNTVFSDVPAGEWYAPFVGYCKQNSIVAGTGGGKFEPGAYVSEKSFLTMLLQALGYKADLDYNWNSVYQKAYEIGVSDDIQDTVRTEDNFLYTRADVVHAIYNSLDTRFKGKTLILSEFLFREHICNKNMLRKHNLLKEDKKASESKKINVINENTLEVVFNEPIYELTADQISIFINNRNIRVKSVNKKNDITFEIITDDSMNSSNKYTIEIKNIIDEDGFVTPSIKSEFQGVKKSLNIPKDFAIVSVTPISNNQVDVRFSREVDANSKQPLLYKFGLAGGVLNEGNFQNLKAEVMGEKSSHVLITFIDYKLNPENNYTLYVRPDFMSANGERLKNGNGDQMDFSGSLAHFDNFTVDDVELVDDHFVKVSFSRSVDENTALRSSNYTLSRMSRNDRRTASDVYFYRDGKKTYDDVVMVRFSTILEDEEYEIEIDDVKDIYQHQKIRRFTDDIYGGADKAFGPELIDVEAVNRSEIHLIFDQPLSKSADNTTIKIDNKNYSSNQILDPEDESVLIVYLKKNLYLKEDEDYTLKVKRGIADYLGRKTTEEQEMDFMGTDEQKPDIYVKEAVMSAPNKIQITFSEPVKESDLNDIDLYKVKYETGSIDRTIFPVKISPLSSTKTVLTLESAYADGNMVVEIKRVHSISGQFTSKDLEVDVQNRD